MVDLTRDTASHLVAELRAGRLSSRELLDAQLVQFERWNPAVNAVVATNIERARAEAVAADEAFVRGGPTGLLHGLPMTIKDSFETEGIVTTSGALELRDHMPARDADPVGRLRAAGAIVFGKTNVPLYAGDWQTYNEVHGRTNNPWDTDRVPGGSSGGAAAAVAPGISPLELGSDIGGSIRVPAHCCGVFGHKPTQGLVPDRGHIPGPSGTIAPPDLGVRGPLGRSVDDLAMAMEVLLSAGMRDAPGTLPAPRRHAADRPRVVVYLDDALCPLGSEVRRVLEAAVAAFAAAGAQLVEASVPPMSDTHRLYQRLLTAVTSAGLPTHVIDEMARIAVDPGHPFHAQAADYGLSHRDWLVADEGRHHLRARWSSDVFAVADVVLAPIAPVPAFVHDSDKPFGMRTIDVDGTPRDYDQVMLPWAGFATLPGLPATAVPVGRTAGGLPVGVQVIGPRWGDLTCLAAARLLERATGGFVPPPWTPAVST